MAPTDEGWPDEKIPYVLKANSMASLEDDDGMEAINRECIATQLYPTFIRLLTTPKLNPLTRQVEGLHFDVERAALMTWRATEALIQIGKETDKGRIDPLAQKSNNSI